MKVTLSAINTPHEAMAAVMGCMKMGDIGQSHWVREFEERIADYVGAKHCIATSSGTMADAVAVAAMAIKHDRHTFVVPALTFIAHPNSVLYNGLKLQFVDVNTDWTMNTDQALKFADTAIAFPSDIMGRIGEYNGLNGTMPVIEDACEAFGSRRGYKKAGTLGEVGTFSFFPSHTLSTGEGGAIVTNDDELAGLCRQLKSHGRASETDPFNKFHFDHLGFNAKMSGLTAAFGCGLIEHVDEYVEKRHYNFGAMDDALGRWPGWPARIDYIVPHGYPISYRDEDVRDVAMRHLLDSGIECRKFFSCIPVDEKAYRWENGDDLFPMAQHIARTSLYVPCHQNLTDAEVRYVVEKVRETWTKFS